MISRRRLIAVAGVAGVGAVGAAGIAAAALVPEPVVDDTFPFEGAHQAGIVTPAQDRLHFVAFDVITKDREKLLTILREWTAAARRMTQGQDAGPVGAMNGIAEAPPDDTGEAFGLSASGLTLTVGFGPALFAKFGLAGKRPAALADLPRLPNDALEEAISGGDLAVQACANDPQVAVHAIRNLARIGMGTVSVRWSQLGFGRTSSTTTGQATPRNLFGFKDGTENVKAEQPDRLRDHVWVQPGDGPEWMTGGSYLVTRKIRMLIETWDRSPLAEQEMIIGRHKGTGAAIGQAGEFDPIDLDSADDQGEPLVALTAHVRLAHPTQNGGARLLRRGYNFVDGSDGLGRLNAGLFFIAYMRDPRTSFVPIQRNLGRSDELNEYIRHVSSGLFACPPGIKDGDDYWGRELFDA